jgi:hypothetical protein
MKLQTLHTEANQKYRRPDYTQMPLLDLSMRIVEYADTQALKELHDNRPLFRYKDDDMLLMANYLTKLKHRNIARQWCGGDFMVLEKAYDHALAKFLNIPAESGNESDSAETGGPDCRYYYEAFYNYAKNRLEAELPTNVIEEELMVAKMLQRMVMRHFYLSCLECKRQGQDLIRRYGWKINGYVLCIWLPTEMPGRRCQTWLRDNIPDVEPTRPGERDRVQAIVNQLLRKPRIVPLYEMNGKIKNFPAKPNHLHSIIEEEISTKGLARVVANEKADNIERQRPAIRHLGVQRLKDMILGVFEGLACGGYEAVSFVGKFGLSKATFSRFAGCKWANNDNGTANFVPDLWRNTAHILASNSCFVQMAQESGVWKRVCQVLNSET